MISREKHSTDIEKSICKPNPPAPPFTHPASLCRLLLPRYFHCDPHPGNLCVDTSGNLVYYDYGMMDELKPNVKAGFKQSPLLLVEKQYPNEKTLSQLHAVPGQSAVRMLTIDSSCSVSGWNPSRPSVVGDCR